MNKWSQRSFIQNINDPKNHFTVPSTLDLEKKTNPFLRPFDKDIRKNLNMIGSTDEQVFSKIRSLKDKFWLIHQKNAIFCCKKLFCTWRLKVKGHTLRYESCI